MNTNVLWMAKCCYSYEDSIPPHYHNFPHLIFVLEPSGTIEVDGVSYPSVANAVYVVPEGIIHAIRPATPRSLKTIEVKFITSSPKLSGEIRSLPRAILRCGQVVRGELEDAFEEGLNKSIFYQEIMDSKIEGVLFALSRMAREPDRPERPVSSAPGKSSAFTDIRPEFANVAEDMMRFHDRHISLSELASRVHLNEAYFSRAFQQQFGVPPIQFLLEVRLRHAKRLLGESDLTVSEIAYKCGFGSVHYFSRFFKKREQLSPTQYREKHRDTHYIELDNKGYRLFGIPV